MLVQPLWCFVYTGQDVCGNTHMVTWSHCWKCQLLYVVRLEACQPAGWHAMHAYQCRIQTAAANSVFCILLRKLLTQVSTEGLNTALRVGIHASLADHLSSSTEVLGEVGFQENSLIIQSCCTLFVLHVLSLLALSASNAHLQPRGMHTASAAFDTLRAQQHTCSCMVRCYQHHARLRAAE
jgi:hypothetical protein